MFNYLLIFFAVVCFTAQFAFTKLYERAAGQSRSATMVMLCVTSLTGSLLFLAVGGFHVNFSPVSAFWALILALIMIPYYMLGIKVLSLGSLAVYSMFMMLGGMLVPFFYGVCFLSETLSVGKAVGTVLLTVCIVMQALGQKEGEEKKAQGKKKHLFFLLCLLIFFINGMTGVVAKIHTLSEGAVDAGSFTATYCAMTALFSLGILVVTCLRNAKVEMARVKGCVKGRPLAAMVLLGVSGNGGAFLQLLAADKVPASVQFPLVSGGVIVLSAVAGVLFFKEKLSRREWVFVAGAFLSTFLYAF